MNIVKIYMITFNVDWLLERSYKSFVNNFLDTFEFNVLDNSSDSYIRANIYDKCKLLNIKYYACCFPKYITMPGLSHGSCLNHLFRNIIPKEEKNYIMVLDHDITLVKKFSLIEYMKDFDICGSEQSRMGKTKDWKYLWGNFFFVKGNLLHEINLSSKCTDDGTKLDTGILLDKISHLKYFSHFPSGNFNIKNENEECGFDTFGPNEEFIHFRGASNWDTQSEHFMKVKQNIYFNICDNNKGKLI